MKEIGGYFGLEKSGGEEYYKNLVALNTGRNSLLYILQARCITKIYIPYYLCDTVSEICKKYGYDFEYYHIDELFRPIFKGELKKTEYIYIVNYFGQLSNLELLGLKSKYRNVIFDNVQAFFQKPMKGVDTIYSCRKFFGVPDGSYLSTDVLLNKPLEQDISSERMKHILGRFEKNASDYYNSYQINDESFYTLELRTMSKITHNLLGSINYENIKRIRSKNFHYLSKMLSKQNRLKLREPIGPYCYPFLCKNGEKIKKELIKYKIYIPTLWPNVLEMDLDYEKQYAQDILPIPCDQRYGIEDMKYLVEKILCVIENMEE